MEYIFKRLLDISTTIARKSIFLFGPRQTGKTYLLKRLFPQAEYYNLLLSDVFFRLSQNPSRLREELQSIKPKEKLIIVDEIQKIPLLLDEVHNLIENGYRFILTGSSARKLKRGEANLLAGRAITKNLFSLVTAEIPNYDLNRILNFGSLPAIYNSKDPQEDLTSYVGTYIKEEIQAEGIIRKLENFSRFLQFAALANTEMLNFSSIASEIGISAKTIGEYFRILEDTLIGSILEPFIYTKKRQPIVTGKFYFFDIGVANILAHRHNINSESELFGKCLEHLIFLELKAYLNYHKDYRHLTYWRSKSGYEVDFLIGNDIGIEVKATKNASNKHFRGIKALAEELPLKRKIIVSNDPKSRLVNDIEILPVKVFLNKLWQGKI